MVGDENKEDVEDIFLSWEGLGRTKERVQGCQIFITDCLPLFLLVILFRWYLVYSVLYGFSSSGVYLYIYFFNLSKELTITTFILQSNLWLRCTSIKSVALHVSNELGSERKRVGELVGVWVWLAGNVSVQG